MKIELKKVNFYPRLSDETNAFNADLYVDGIKVAACENQGKGGPTNIWVINKEKCREYQTFIKTLPPERCEYTNKDYPVTEEDYVNQLFDTYLRQKEISKLTKKSILYADKETDDDWYKITYKIPISQIMANPKGREALLQRVEDLRKDGKHVFNTNIK